MHHEWHRDGFTALNAPERWMENWVKDAYGARR